MANYSFTINSQYKPFSYAELTAPLIQATEAHQKLEDAYATMALQAAEAASEANAQTDPITFARYKSYADDLAARADSLARNGLRGPADRQALMDLRTRYGEEIIPIQKAIAHRQEEAKMQQAALLQNPSLMFERRAAATSLDDYLSNPGIYQNIRLASGNDIKAAASAMAAKLATELTEYGYDAPLDSFTNVIKKKYGYTKEQLQKFLADPDSAEADQVLKSIMEMAVDSSGMKNWADDNTLNRGYGYAKEGLWGAVGPEDKSATTNQKAIADYQHALTMAQKAMEHQYAMEEIGARNAKLGKSGSGGLSETGWGKSGKSPIPASREEFKSAMAGLDNVPREQAYEYLIGLAEEDGKFVSKPSSAKNVLSEKQRYESLPEEGRAFIDKSGGLKRGAYKGAQELYNALEKDYTLRYGKPQNSDQVLKFYDTIVKSSNEVAKKQKLKNPNDVALIRKIAPNTYNYLRNSVITTTPVVRPTYPGSAYPGPVQKNSPYLEDTNDYLGGIGDYIRTGVSALTGPFALYTKATSKPLFESVARSLSTPDLQTMKPNEIKKTLNNYVKFNNSIEKNIFDYMAETNISGKPLALRFKDKEGNIHDNILALPQTAANMYLRDKTAFSNGLGKTGNILDINKVFRFDLSSTNYNNATKALDFYLGNAPLNKVDTYQSEYNDKGEIVRGIKTKGEIDKEDLKGTDPYFKVMGYEYSTHGLTAILGNKSDKNNKSETVKVQYPPESEPAKTVKECTDQMQAAHDAYVEALANNDFVTALHAEVLYKACIKEIEDTLSGLQLVADTESQNF